MTPQQTKLNRIIGRLSRQEHAATQLCGKYLDSHFMTALFMLKELMNTEHSWRVE
jgi:hypothetical protein